MYNSHRLAKLCISSPFSLQSEPLHLAKLTPKNSVRSRFHGDSWITTFTCFGLQTSRFFPENFTYRNANLAFVFKEMVLFCFNGPNFQEI